MLPIEPDNFKNDGTDLDPEVIDRIIEMATIITDGDLNVIAEGPVLAIRQEQALLDGMDEWNTNQHNKSGLVDRIKKSSYTYADAEEMTIEFLEKYIDKK